MSKELESQEKERFVLLSVIKMGWSVAVIKMSFGERKGGGLICFLSYLRSWEKHPWGVLP
jgi:hypothetical protein